MRIIKLDESSKKNILNDLLKRSPNNYDNFADSVNAILANVKENGDKALFQYTKDFDKADINASNIKVTEEEIKEAYDRLENTTKNRNNTAGLIQNLMAPFWVRR